MITILQGDVREQLAKLPDASVQCCVTSPPYWGLRDYGTAAWEGGDPTCNHRPPDEAGQTNKPTVGQREHAGRFSSPTCWRCGARRIDKQLGLERTPEEYVAKMVEVFREVRRVLREDGTLWLNLGDSYAPSRGGGHKDWHANPGISNSSRRCGVPHAAVVGLKPKDLCGIPWRVAFALQADGWYLRQDIIWHKPNPMPESVTDRCTKAHEYIFLLTKSARYYYDAEAISESTIYPPGTRDDAIKGSFNSKYAGDIARIGDESFRAIRSTRNRRSVWTITPKPYHEAHFATFPPELPRLCISAGSKSGDTVLDPFAGSGTTGQVANELGRNAVLIELKPEYCALIRKRCAMCEETEGTL